MVLILSIVNSTFLCTAVTFLGDPSTFAVLALLPKLATESQEMALGGRDGAILAFNVNRPDPVAVWSVRKVHIVSVLLLFKIMHSMPLPFISSPLFLFIFQPDRTRKGVHKKFY